MSYWQKALLVITAVILSLWRLFEIPAVSQAFWNFCTIGAIPGTDYVLGSESTIRLLIFIFVIVVFVVFRKEFMASLPKSRGNKSPVLPTTRIPAAAPEKQVVIHLNTLRSRKTSPDRVRFLPAMFGIIVVAIVHLVLRLEALLLDSFNLMKRYGYLAYKKSRPHITTTIRKLLRFINVSIRLGAHTAAKVWRWSEPRIRTFDAWLEAQLHANERTADMLQLLEKFFKFVDLSYHKLVKIAQRLVARK